MSTSQWRYAYASATGSAHLEQGTGCQDAAACALITGPGQTETLIAVVADGAGSATEGATGAATVCASFQDAATRRLRDLGSLAMLDRFWFSHWLSDIQRQLDNDAEAAGKIRRDYACTLCAAVVAPDAVVLFQIGDGLIISSLAGKPGAYTAAFPPGRGEYANETYFVTDPSASRSFAFKYEREVVAELSLTTDGLERLVYQVTDQTPHAPFFTPSFATVAAAPPGHADDLSAALSTLLDSARVRARTDDDTTILLATRRQPDQNPVVGATAAG